MLPPNLKPDWSSNDCLSLRAFLDSDTGQRMIYHLGESAPSLLDGTHKNKTLVASGVVKGYTEALANIFSLLVEPPKSVPPEKSSHPSIDDESAWNSDNTPK